MAHASHPSPFRCFFARARALARAFGRHERTETLLGTPAAESAVEGPPARSPPPDADAWEETLTSKRTRAMQITGAASSPENVTALPAATAYRVRAPAYVARAVCVRRHDVRHVGGVADGFQT